MELYIVRHGQSTNNALADRSERVADPPLTPLGRRQAEMVAQHLATGMVKVPDGELRPYGIGRLYCSAMERALDTAQVMGSALGLVPEVWLDIHEVGGIYLDGPEGPEGYAGKTRQEIEDEYPGFVLPDGITDEGWWNRPREDRRARLLRAGRVVAALRERAGGDERIALVTHGGFVNVLQKVLFRQAAGTNMWFDLYNTAISRIDFYADGHVSVQFLNRVDHLPPELVT